MVYISMPILLYCSLMFQIVIVKTAAVSSRQLFSRGLVNFQTIRTFSGVSVKRCQEECNRRNRCRSVVYQRRSALCTLTSNRNPDEPVVEDRGIVMMTGFNAGGSSCGSNVCAKGDACIAEGNGHICKPTECGQLPSFYTNVQGNMYAHANKLIIKGSISDIAIKCSDHGVWKLDNLYSAMDCSAYFGYSGAYQLPFVTREVYCDMETDEGHWLVFQRRQDGTVPFQRNWNDYVGGFGDIMGEFWLGLQPLYEILLTGDFELRIDLEKFSGERAYAKYSTFTVSGPQDNYRLGVSGYTGNAGDSLTYMHNGRRFTTPDHDNDEVGYNCASRYKGAWWYAHCHNANLNGLYFPSGDNTVIYAEYINWKTWTGYYHSLKRTEMKIRRKLN